ncbi:pyridoxamine 5'-phosphate oxidase family protein [Ahrensia marina]|uniref:pyridoxamine 5'-phosphate oxidase family protein n=1 Tax=Ahrensia marina TaxID=1514904 RepID=UPI0035D0CD84
MSHSKIDSIEALEALYGTPVAAATVKVSSVITPEYRALIQASPFCALATVGPEGLDCSPRGDAPENGMDGMVRIVDERTLMIPDRRGNNRLDSLRNIVRDPRVALLFLIPGSGTTLRINGQAHITADPDVLERYAVDRKTPRSVIVIAIEEIYFQCARAVVRADLWNAEKHADPGNLPTPGDILAVQSAGEEGGETYDRGWPDRAAKTMW